MFNVL